MPQERYKRQQKDSFFGEWIYDRVVPQDHFLRKLEEMVPWERFTAQLVEFYAGGAMYGRPPYDPAVMLKMLLMAYLYDLSERATEQQINDSLSMKWFLGLAVDEPAPHHSTLTKFRQRLLKKGNGEALEQMLNTIVVLAQEKGVVFGSIQVIDSVHTIADVNTAKDDSRRKGGKPPRDGDAAWGVKHTKKERDEKGRPVERRQYFHGYKAHVSMNAGSDLITSLGVTPGNAYDGHRLPDLVKSDMVKGLPISTVTADRAYDDGENHYLLEIMGLHSAIILNDVRTQKKDSNKQIWFDLLASETYQRGTRERYKIERKFGEAKQGHGFGRCRYLGIDGYRMQSYMTAIALNLKRMVKLLANTSFRGRATAWA